MRSGDTESMYVIYLFVVIANLPATASRGALEAAIGTYALRNVVPVEGQRANLV